MTTPPALLDWAKKQLGVTENPPNSNHVRYWDDVGMSGAQGQPWCAAFYLAGLTAVGVKPVSRSVFVPTLVSDYRSAKRLYRMEDAEPGDQVLYHFGHGHTGIVESVDLGNRMVTAIEGNTSANAQGSQDNGGGVFRKVRPWTDISGCGRPLFDTSTENPQPFIEENDMPMIVLDPKGPDDLGRDSHWEFDRFGNAFNWNGARPLKSLSQLDPQPNLPIVAVIPDPSGDGVVLMAGDTRQDERGHWVRSTYRITVDM